MGGPAAKENPPVKVEEGQEQSYVNPVKRIVTDITGTAVEIGRPDLMICIKMVPGLSCNSLSGDDVIKATMTIIS